MKKILIACPMNKSFLDGLEEMGWTCQYEPEISESELREVIGEFHGIVVSTRIQMDRELIELGTSLKLIARAGSGMENIDVEFASSKKILCLNSPEGNRDAVAEHALGLLLALTNQIYPAVTGVKSQLWQREENRGRELKGLVAGVIGFGNTGTAFSERLFGIGVQVLAYDKYKKNFGSEKVKESNQNEINKEADIVSFHLPLTSETRQMVNREYLNKFKKPVWLINTSRGEIINHHDLVIALEEKRLAGAGLDVIENEEGLRTGGWDQPWLKKLLAMENVLITPHIAGWSFESKERTGMVLLKKIRTLGATS